MPHITTCSQCGSLYEESSEERANEPDRLCLKCWTVGRELERVRREVPGALNIRWEIERQAGRATLVITFEQTGKSSAGWVRRTICRRIETPNL